MARLGPARFMAVNMITSDAMLSVSSQAAGQASKAQKSGAGSATMAVTGAYTGTENLDYYIEIETTGSIGTATFRWSDNGGVTWDATGVATSASPVVLNNGLSVAWTAGAGDDVVDGDVWQFKGFLPYHRQYLLDRDRDTEWRTAVVTGTPTIDIDLGTAQTPTVLILMDHNLSSSGGVWIQASDVSNYSSLAINEHAPWRTPHILYYLEAPGAHRYWRVALNNTANGDGYLRAAELFLGVYVQLDRTYELGDTQGKLRMGKREQHLSGKFFGGLNTVVRVFDLSWIRLTVEDRDAVVAVFDALNDLTNRQILPVYFNSDSNDLTRISLCEWQEGTVLAMNETDAPERYSVPVRLDELPRTV